MRFEEPPVVEAWIEFKFALSQEKSAWDEDAAKSFMRQCFKDLKPDSLSRYARIEVDARTGKLKPGGVEAVFDRIRAFSDKRDQCVQAGRDTLAYNQLNTGKWPGYATMRDAALEAVTKYMAFRDLNELITVMLHYRDVVSVPRMQEPGINLKDWFKIYPEIPSDVFGEISGFTFGLQFPNMCEAAIVALTIGSLPLTAKTDSESKFLIDWHVSSIDRIDDLDSAKQWLDAAHAAFKRSFEKAFTSRCLELFKPVTGE